MKLFYNISAFSMVCVAHGAVAQTLSHQTGQILSARNLPIGPTDMPQAPVVIQHGNDKEIPTNSASLSAISVGAVHVEGSSDIPAAAFSAAIAPYIGNTLSMQDLAVLTHAVADVARNKGYSFASAYVPPQALDLGILTVRLDEGMIARVQVNGTKNQRVIKILNALTGHAPTASETEHQILLAADVPGISINKVSYVRLGEQGMLVVDVKESKITGYLALDNYGSHTLGPTRATAVIQIPNAFIPGDQVTAQILTTPVKPKELAFAALKYDLPTDNQGTILSVAATYGYVRPGEELSVYRVHGRSYDLGLNLKHPVLRARKLSIWASAGFDYLSSSQNILGQTTTDEKLSVVSVAANGNAKLWGGQLRGDATLSRGLSIFDASRPGDGLLSRPSANAEFTKLVLSADWSGTLIPGIEMRVAGLAQFTSDPLLVSQQISAGGQGFGRAFDYSTITGDYGTEGSIELRHSFIHLKRWFDYVQPYIFIDAANFKTINDSTNDSRLYSTGGGVRATAGKFNMALEGAVPLHVSDDPNIPSNTARLNLSVGRRF